MNKYEIVIKDLDTGEEYIHTEAVAIMGVVCEENVSSYGIRELSYIECPAYVAEGTAKKLEEQAKQIKKRVREKVKKRK